MKTKIRKILGLVLSLVMCISVIPAQNYADQVMAAEELTSNIEWKHPSNLYVGDTKISVAGYWLNDGNGSLTMEGANAENYNVHYDGKGTVYLNDLYVATADGSYGIYISRSTHFQIVVSGKNTVDISAVDANYKNGLYADSSCNLYITGSGSLNCVASNDELGASSAHRGVNVTNLYIEDATLKGSVGQTTGSVDGYGVYVTSLTMKDGKLEGICSKTYYGYGIYVAGNMDCKNSVITGTSAGRERSYGLYLKGSATYEETELYATTQTVSSRNYGFYCEAASASEILIKNSELHASSGATTSKNTTTYTYGIYIATKGVLKAENSNVYATAGAYNISASSASSTGIWGNVTFSSGTIVAKGMKKSFNSIPTVPEIDYWWRESNGGSYLKNNFETPLSVYCEITTETQEEAADGYIIFDTNSGAFADGSTQKRVMVKKGQIDSWEVPERFDYYFRGWNDVASGGTQVDFSDVEALIGTTVYAKWEATYRPTTFYIGSTQITSAGYWKNDGAGALTTDGASETDYNVYYDGVNGLIIKDLNISTCYSNATTRYGIYAASGNLNIEVIGENVIDVAATNLSALTYNRGIYARQLKLFGGGKLTVKSGKASSQSYGIQCTSNLVVDNVGLHCVSGNSSSYSYGIKATDISIKNSNVVTETISGATERYGIYGYEITFDNSDVNCDSCGTYGIYAAADNIIIKDATVSSINNATAIHAIDLGVTNSNVALQGTTKSMNLTGQFNYVSGHLIANGSRTATINITADKYWWRNGENDFFVKNGYTSSTASYLELTTVQPEKVAKATIIFNAEDKTFSDGTNTKVVVSEDGYIKKSQIPTLNTYAGYFFNYWQMEDGTEVDLTQEFSDTIIITPKFTEPSVLIANTDISEGGYWLNDGEGGITKEGASENNYNLYYDGVGNMTLKGLDVTDATNYLRAQYTSGVYGLYSKVALKITVIGKNKINISDEVVYVTTYGIYAAKSLAVMGTGSLYICAKTSNGYTSSSSYGIYAGGAIEMTDVELEVSGESASSSSSYYGYGIYGGTALILTSSKVTSSGSSYGVYTKSRTTLEQGAKLYAVSNGYRSYEGVYGNIAISAGTAIAERASAGKCFGSTPTFSTDYWWRNQSEGRYLRNTYISGNSYYVEVTTEEPEEVALTYVTLNGNGGTVDGVISKDVFTDKNGNISKEMFSIEPIYYDYYFAGWFTEQTYENEIDLYDTTFTEPMTLYAKWNPIEVTIGDVNVSEGGYWIHDGGGSLTQKDADESNYNVYYDGEANLTLRNLNITGLYQNVSYKSTLHFKVPVTVTLIGQNVIRRTTGAGVYAHKDVVFSGAGELGCIEATLISNPGTRCFYFVGGVTVDKAKLYIDGASTAYGVSANSLIVKNGGILESYGGQTDESGYTTSYGIYVENVLEIVGGIVKGIGGETYNSSSDAYSYGVYADKIVISGGKLEGTSGKTYRSENCDYYPKYGSIGICGVSLIEVFGGEVIGISDDVNPQSGDAWTCGIMIPSGGTMNLVGGKVIGECGNVPMVTSYTRQNALWLGTSTFNMTGGELILQKGMSASPKTLPTEYRWRTTPAGKLTSSIDTPYTYSSNDYLQIVSEELVSEKTITLYSSTTDGLLNVSKVSGGGIYNKGNTAQLQAGSLEGYIFIGWYVARLNDENECIGYDKDLQVSDNSKYSFEIDKNVSYVAVYEKITSKVTGYTLSLFGDIAVNIHMTLTKDVLADDSALIKVTFADGEIIKGNISELESKTVNGVSQYIFTCNVQAPEMSDMFVIELVTKDGDSQLDTYSVKEYGDYVLSHMDDNAEYAKAAPVIRAMLNYGGYSQKQFKHNTGSLANEGLYTEDTDPVLNENVTVADNYQFTAPSEDIGLQYYGSSLLLNSETTIRHYFTISGDEDLATIRDNYIFILGGEITLTPGMKGAMVYVDVKNINAAELHDMFSVKVMNNNTEANFTVNYSPFCYAKYVLENTIAGTNLMNVIKAMCLYNIAAKQYFN